MKKILVWFLTAFFCAGSVIAGENEVVPVSRAKVFVREHPQTGKPFVSLRNEGNTQDLFRGFKKREVRPDYRMLDAKTKSGAVPYDGPASDRTKVYVFAATMMTLGVAGGIVSAAAIPATAATTGASGGAGLFGAGAVAVAGGTVGTVAVKSRLKPGEENSIHEGTATAVTKDPGQLRLRDVLREIDAEKTPVI